MKFLSGLQHFNQQLSLVKNHILKKKTHFLLWRWYWWWNLLLVTSLRHHWVSLRRLQWTAVRKLNLTGLAPYTQIFYDMFIFARYFMTYLYLPDILWHIYICQIFYDMLIFARYFMIFLYLPEKVFSISEHLSINCRKGSQVII